MSSDSTYRSGSTKLAGHRARRSALGRIWTAYQIEVGKAARTRTTCIGPILLAAAVASAPLLRPLARDGQSDYSFISFATTPALGLLGLFLILIYSAGLVSSELGSGTIRLVLVRPLLRHEFVLAKLMGAITYAALLVVATCAPAWVLACVFGDLAGVGFGGEVLYTASEMVQAYLLGMALALAPLAATAAFGVMISCLTRSTAVAMTSAVGVWIVVDTIKHPLGLAPYLFSSYLETPWRVFSDLSVGMPAHWMPEAWRCLAASFAALVVFTGVGCCAMRRRNLQA